MAKWFLDTDCQTTENFYDKFGEIIYKQVQIDSGLDGTYSTASSSFAQLAFNLLVGGATAYDLNRTIIKCIIIAEVDCDLGTTGEIDLYNFTDSAQISGSVSSFSNTSYGLVQSTELTLTAGKTYRIRLRRVTGSGQASIQIRAGALVIKIQ